jgi:hypothetical protein
MYELRSTRVQTDRVLSVPGTDFQPGPQIASIPPRPRTGAWHRLPGGFEFLFESWCCFADWIACYESCALGCLKTGRSNVGPAIEALQPHPNSWSLDAHKRIILLDFLRFRKEICCRYD